VAGVTRLLVLRVQQACALHLKCSSLHQASTSRWLVDCVQLCISCLALSAIPTLLDQLMGTSLFVGLRCQGLWPVMKWFGTGALHNSHVHTHTLARQVIIRVGWELIMQFKVWLPWCSHTLNWCLFVCLCRRFYGVFMAHLDVPASRQSIFWGICNSAQVGLWTALAVFVE